MKKILKCLERIKNTIAISAEQKVYVQTVRTLHQLNVACNVIAYLHRYAVLIKGLRVCTSVLYEIKENSGLEVPKKKKKKKNTFESLTLFCSFFRARECCRMEENGHNDGSGAAVWSNGAGHSALRMK